MVRNIDILKGMNPDELKQSIVEQIALTAVHSGTTTVNYMIMRSLPNSINDLITAIGINKVNINKHINQLETVGLVKRHRGTGKEELDQLGIALIDLISRVERKVRTDMSYDMEKET